MSYFSYFAISVYFYGANVNVNVNLHIVTGHTLEIAFNERASYHRPTDRLVSYCCPPLDRWFCSDWLRSSVSKPADPTVSACSHICTVTQSRSQLVLGHLYRYNNYYVPSTRTILCRSPKFCFLYFLNASKATASWLHGLLVARCLHLVRVLLNVYANNFVRVQWCGIVSDYFLTLNSVKQGSVLSPIVFAWT